MKFHQFFTYLEHEKRYSIHTIEAYKRDLGQFKEYLALQYEISSEKKVTQPIIRSWILSLMEAGVTSKSVNRKISTLRSYFKYLLKQGAITANPAADITSPKIGKQLPQFLKEEEMENLLEQMEFSLDFEGTRDKLILELFYQTGIRTSELIGLMESDINRQLHQLKVLGKRNKERIIPISNILMELISDYLVKKRQYFDSEIPYLIVLDSGKKPYRKFVYNKVKYYLTQVSSLKKRSPHVLRHTFATHMLKNGADLNAIKEILGHASLAATQVYAHNTLEQLKEVHKMAHPRNK